MGFNWNAINILQHVISLESGDRVGAMITASQPELISSFEGKLMSWESFDSNFVQSHKCWGLRSQVNKQFLPYNL